MHNIFTSKNFAVIIMTLALCFLLIMLCQACSKKSYNSSEDSEEDYVSHDSLSYTYDYGDSEAYTNSQYLRSDEKNSFIDHANFKYDQSLRDSLSNSRADDSNASDSGAPHADYTI